MHAKFDQKKTTQAAGLLLRLSHEKKMHYIKLVKLLYLADREALLKWGRPVTYDHYVSMDNGPVLSKTLDLITDEPKPGEDSFWLKYISEPQHFVISLKIDPAQDELSEAEIDLLKEVSEKYGKMDRWKLIDDVMHKLPEWIDPHGSAVPIFYRDILRASNKTPQEIASILDELEFVQSSKEIFEDE